MTQVTFGRLELAAYLLCVFILAAAPVLLVWMIYDGRQMLAAHNRIAHCVCTPEGVR